MKKRRGDVYRKAAAVLPSHVFTCCAIVAAEGWPDQSHGAHNKSKARAAYLNAFAPDEPAHASQEDRLQGAFEGWQDSAYPSGKWLEPTSPKVLALRETALLFAAAMADAGDL